MILEVALVCDDVEEVESESIQQLENDGKGEIDDREGEREVEKNKRKIELKGGMEVYDG